MKSLCSSFKTLLPSTTSLQMQHRYKILVSLLMIVLLTKINVFYLLQVGLITFSSGAEIQFQLNEHTDVTSLQNALDQIRYTGTP